jgi:hypothetical protein
VTGITEEPLPTQVFDEYGFDITERLIAEFGSVAEAFAFARRVLDRLGWPVDGPYVSACSSASAACAAAQCAATFA